MVDQMKGLAGALDFLKELEEGQEGRFLELSRALLNNLFVLLRSAGMHDLGNEAMHRPYQAMIETVNEFMELFNEDVALQMVDGNFFVNKRIVKLDFSTFENVRYLRRIFEFLGVNEMLFSAKADLDTLRKFLIVFLRIVRQGGGPIAKENLGSIKMRIMEASALDELRLDIDPRNRILSIYAAGLLMLRQFVNDLRKGRSPRHSKVKRLCLELIDVEPKYHAMLLSLIHLEAYKGNLFCHMLNTAVMAIVFGQRLGLKRKQLVDLGMAAFHHDLGWALLGTLDGNLSSDEVALTMSGINNIRDRSSGMMEELRTKVARALVRVGGFNELVINRLIVAYECQIPEDSKPADLYYGYIEASFMTNVVRMASSYDELTTSKDGRLALLPDQAMKRILDDGGKTYDIFLAKLFANCIGAYPVGTLVELDTTEIGLVVNLPINPVNFHRPQVRLLIDRTGKPVASGPILDLDERLRDGRFVRSIERTLDSREYGITITQFFFG